RKYLPRSVSGCATKGPASIKRSCLACSSRSSRATAPWRRSTRAPASASPSPSASPSNTVEPSKSAAPRGKGPLSSSTYPPPLRPAAIRLDLDLDGEDGLLVLQALKADPGTRQIPVVIESVLAEEKRGLLLGAAEYLTKPLDRGRLLESIGRLGRVGAGDAK